MLTHGFPPAFRDGIRIHLQPPSGPCRVHRVTQLRIDGVHCRESAGSGPVVLKVVLVGSLPVPSTIPWSKFRALSCPTPTIEICINSGICVIQDRTYLSRYDDWCKGRRSKRRNGIIDDATRTNSCRRAMNSVVLEIDEAEASYLGCNTNRSKRQGRKKQLGLRDGQRREHQGRRHTRNGTQRRKQSQKSSITARSAHACYLVATRARKR